MDRLAPPARRPPRRPKSVTGWRRRSGGAERSV